MGAIYIFLLFTEQGSFTKADVWTILFSFGVTYVLGITAIRIGNNWRNKRGQNTSKPYVTGNGSCAVCHRSDNISELVYIDPKKGFSGIGKPDSKKLCREHFMDEYKKAFLAQTSKMLVVKPCFTFSSSAFYFVTLSDLSHVGFDEEDVAMVSGILGKVPTGKECAYVDESHLFSSTYQATKPKYFGDIPVEYISKAEAWKRVEDEFKKHQGDFVEGFSSAYRDEAGIYMNTVI